MKVPYDQDWFTAREVAACLSVNRTTLLRMIREGRFPKPCRYEGQRALWGYWIVEDKIRTQLHLWLGNKLLACEGYEPLRLRRPVGMTRRDAEKLLEKIQKVSRKRANRRFAPKPAGGDEFEKLKEHQIIEEACRLSRAYSQACHDARVAVGRRLSVDERVTLYKRFENPTHEKLVRFRRLLERVEDDYRRPLKIKAIIYVEPEAVGSPPPTSSSRTK